jgi:hypothetical protein
MRSQSNSGLTHAGKPTWKAPISTVTCIVLSNRNCSSNSLPDHQLKRSLGPFDLWKQVQKSQKFVDFTSVGAQIENCIFS